jgi:hypothetical protein
METLVRSQGQMSSHGIVECISSELIILLLLYLLNWSVLRLDFCVSALVVRKSPLCKKKWFNVLVRTAYCLLETPETVKTMRRIKFKIEPLLQIFPRLNTLLM